MAKSDRRVQRTRELLQKTLIELISERGYDAITIQDIVDRANVGRTTYYLHYSSKDELFMSCHEAIVSEFHSLHPRSREELLSAEAPPRMISAYRHLLNARTLLYPIFQGKSCDESVTGARKKSKPACVPPLPKPTAPSRSTCWRTIWRGRRSRWCNGGSRGANPIHPKT
jgi:AcrR family transcriptional regulator